MGDTIRHALLSIAVPCLVLLGANALVPRMAELPVALAGVAFFGMAIALALSIIVGLAFRRGRAVFALLTLTIAYVVHGRYLQPGVAQDVVFAVFGALCLFVPFNLGALSLLAERGVFNRHGTMRLAVIAVEVALAAWATLPGNAMTREWLYAPLVGQGPWTSSPVPQLGIVAIAAGVTVACAAWYRTRAATELALAGATLAFGLAAHGITTTHAFEAFVAAGALILAIGVLQDTFRMAFRDELTGLPSRRALNERLAELGRRYTVAMIDVDHFKNLNDTHGHDVGDQVLKLAASRIARVGGGGKAYRFGGEEFTVIFAGKSVEEAVPHLEALRESLAQYRMEMRRSTRARQDRPRGKRSSRKTEEALSVTVSIGVAESGARLETPEAVIQAADKALYRAKDKGRNRVSR